METKFIRVNKKILNMKTNVVTVYRFYNEAKRASRAIQGEKLGNGLLVCRSTLPKGDYTVEPFKVKSNAQG